MVSVLCTVIHIACITRPKKLKILSSESWILDIVLEYVQTRVASDWTAMCEKRGILSRN